MPPYQVLDQLWAASTLNVSVACAVRVFVLTVCGRGRGAGGVEEVVNFFGARPRDVFHAILVAVHGRGKVALLEGFGTQLLPGRSFTKTGP